MGYSISPPGCEQKMGILWGLMFCCFRSHEIDSNLHVKRPPFSSCENWGWEKNICLIETFHLFLARSCLILRYIRRQTILFFKMVLYMLEYHATHRFNIWKEVIIFFLTKSMSLKANQQKSLLSSDYPGFSWQTSSYLGLSPFPVIGKMKV